MSPESKTLLIVLDAARRDETHAAVAASQLPTLAGAATGTLIAPSCWTLPSMASVLTGLFSAEHGMTWPLTGMRCQSPTVADMRRNAGRSFRLLSGNHIYAPPVMNLPDECVGVPRRQRFRGAAFLGRALGVADYGGRAILQEVRRMAADGNLPDLLILHLQETHHPYLAPPEGIAPLERVRYALGHLAYYATTSTQVSEFAANADEYAWAEQRPATAGASHGRSASSRRCCGLTSGRAHSAVHLRSSPPTTASILENTGWPTTKVRCMRNW